MGDIADMMLDGTLCARCGIYLDEEEADGNADGYPRYCHDCKKEIAEEKKEGDSR